MVREAVQAEQNEALSLHPARNRQDWSNLPLLAFHYIKKNRWSSRTFFASILLDQVFH